MKIAIFSPSHSLGLIQEVLERNGLASEFQLFVYDDFREIVSLYHQAEGAARGVMVTGQLPLEYLKLKVPDRRLPVVSVQHSRLRPALYLLRHTLLHPDIPMNEVFCDFIHEIRDYALYADVIPAGMLPQTMTITSLTDDFADKIAQQVSAGHRAGQIKMAYLTITHLYERFEALGIPCQLIAIQPDAVLQAARELLDKTQREERLPNTVTAAVLEYGTGRDEADALEYREATLMKALVDYKRASGLGLTIARGVRSLDIYLSGSGEEGCHPILPLLEGLKAEFSALLHTGVGLGPDPRTAHIRATQALAHAREYGPGSAFCRDQHQLTGPLLSAGCLSLEDSLLAMAGEMAKKLNISPMNYTRLLALFHQTETPITSDNVAQFLNVTVRSANRILLALLTDGIIEELPADGAKGRGRPVKHYGLTNRIKGL